MLKFLYCLLSKLIKKARPSKANKKDAEDTVYQEELKSLQKLKDSNQIIMINGSFGVGKTWLVKKLASGDRYSVIDDIVESEYDDDWWMKKDAFNFPKTKLLKKKTLEWKKALLRLLGFIPTAIATIWSVPVILEIWKIIITAFLSLVLFCVFWFWIYNYRWKSFKKRKKNIIIENADRLPWKFTYKLLKNVFALKSANERLTFFITCSQENLQNKFLLKYGIDFKNFLFHQEIEKFLDKIINLDDSVKNIRPKMIELVAKDAMKNLQNSKLLPKKTSESMINELIKEAKQVYDQQDLKNFRVLDKAFQETYPLLESVSILELDIKVIFLLKMLLYLNTKTYNNFAEDINLIHEHIDSGNCDCEWNEWRLGSVITTHENAHTRVKIKTKISKENRFLIGRIILLLHFLHFGEKGSKGYFKWSIYFLNKGFKNTLKLFKKDKYEQIYTSNEIDSAFRYKALEKIKHREKQSFRIISQLISDMQNNSQFERKYISILDNINWKTFNELEIYWLLFKFRFLIDSNEINWSQITTEMTISDIISLETKEMIESFEKSSNQIKRIFCNIYKAFLKKWDEMSLKYNSNIQNKIKAAFDKIKREGEEKNHLYQLFICFYMQKISFKHSQILDLFKGLDLYDIPTSALKYIEKEVILELTNKKSNDYMFYIQFPIPFRDKKVEVSKENENKILKIYENENLSNAQ